MILKGWFQLENMWQNGQNGFLPQIIKDKILYYFPIISDRVESGICTQAAVVSCLTRGPWETCTPF